MAEIRNVTRQRLEAGGVALGVGLRQARTADTAKILKTAGFDWLFIDLEHSVMDLDTATNIAVAGQDAGITPITRVPQLDINMATRALDGGSQGIVFPHVDDPETAARLAKSCIYPPKGKRSMTGLLPQLNFQAHPLGEQAAAVNASNLIIVMIETPEAVANADKIAAVEGVDVLLIGTNDLCMEMGIPGQFDHAKVTDAYSKVIAACKAHGKHPGMGGVYRPDIAERYVKMGANFVLAGSDLAFLMGGAKAQAEKFRAMS